MEKKPSTSTTKEDAESTNEKEAVNELGMANNGQLKTRKPL